MNKCLNCQQETQNVKFCSKSCAASYNNRGVTRNKPKSRQCSSCGTAFFRSNGTRSTLCNKCRIRVQDPDFYKKRTLAEYHNLLSVKNKHPSWKNSHIRTLNRSWNKHLANKPCAHCGYDKHVELCHIKAITSFPETATLGEINSEFNNIQLCRNCHWELDNGFLILASLSL